MNVPSNDAMEEWIVGMEDVQYSLVQWVDREGARTGHTWAE